MRRFLDGLYGAAGLLAGLCTIGVLVSVLAAIIARQLSMNIPGTDAYAGYFMAAAGFLALASTFKHGEHIRVTLLLDSCNPPPAAGSISSRWPSAACWPPPSYVLQRPTYDSWQFNDISTSNDATPLWIPQLSMAVGTVLVLVALIDELIRRSRGLAAATSQQTHE